MPSVTSAPEPYFFTFVLYSCIAGFDAFAGLAGSSNGVTVRMPLAFWPAAVSSSFDTHVPDMYVIGFQPAAPTAFNADGHANSVPPSTNASALLAASDVTCDVTCGLLASYDAVCLIVRLVPLMSSCR